MKIDLSNKCVLITGAGSHIGQGIARTLADCGAKVVLHYRRSRDAVEPLANDLNAELVQADFTNADSVAQLVSELDGKLPNALVNNAADQDIAGLKDMTRAQWQHMFAANVEGVVDLTQRLIQRWCDAETAGSVVNISSIEGLDPASGHAHYASSKAALNMYTRACAAEFGHLGIRVNSVSPGLIHRDGIAEHWPEGVARWQDKAPLSRLGTPQDVASAVAFLLSDAAAWISGHNLVVDGGMSAQTRW